MFGLQVACMDFDRSDDARLRVRKRPVEILNIAHKLDRHRSYSTCSRGPYP